jgi:sugar lactone lactonase YvrE
MSLSVIENRVHTPFFKSSCLSFLALALCVSNAWAAAPAVFADAQRTILSGLNNPQAFAGNSTNGGALFVADTNNNQIVVLVNGNRFHFDPPGFTLSQPKAIAMDAQGDLFIADTPSRNVGRIIEMPASEGMITGTAKVVFSGTPLTNPIAMTVDSTGTLFVGDYPASGRGVIYSLTRNATTLTRLNFTGLAATLEPAALVRDSSTNLYIADKNSINDGIYKASDTGGAATSIRTPDFVITRPSGLALDASGSLYILSTLGANAQEQVTVIPAASPNTPYIVPNNAIKASSALLFDAKGNLDVLSSRAGGIYQFTFGAPVNLGSTSTAAKGAPVIFNFEFNASAALSGFSIVSAGDVSTELTQTAGTCTNGAHRNLTAAAPYTCEETYEGTPKYPGFRSSAILVKGSNNTVLAAVPVYQIGVAGVQITYPLDATETAGGLEQPQAIAISGLNNTVYVADEVAGKVYSLHGLGGATLTPVSTGAIHLVAPSALAVDGAGNLFIADFGVPNLGQVVKVSPTTGAEPVVINTGCLLQHPISLALDAAGNLYIGDAGPAGFDASSADPGYLVKVPTGGTAFKLNTPNLPIVFPQALATNVNTGYLYVGDGGDLSGVGQVDVITMDGTSVSQLALPNVTNPTGLTFDPAGNLYVLDGYVNTVTVDPLYLNNPTPYLLQFDNSALAAPSSIAMSAGGQSLVISNIGMGADNNLVFVNGNTSTLDFGSVARGTQSQAMTATVANIGNATLTLGIPYYATTTANPAFSILNSSTCTNDLTLGAGGSTQNNGSCDFNFEFKPIAAGLTSQQFTLHSNAYNKGIPILRVQGTGTGNGSVQKPNPRKWQRARAEEAKNRNRLRFGRESRFQR